MVTVKRHAYFCEGESKEQRTHTSIFTMTCFLACALICHDKCRHKAASCRPIYPTVIAKVCPVVSCMKEYELTCHLLEHFSTLWFISTSYTQQAAKDVGVLVSVMYLHDPFYHTIYTRIYSYQHMHTFIGSNPIPFVAGDLSYNATIEHLDLTRILLSPCIIAQSFIFLYIVNDESNSQYKSNWRRIEWIIIRYWITMRTRVFTTGKKENTIDLY